MNVHAHRASAATFTHIRCAAITVSDTRTKNTDRSGKVIQELAKEAGFSVSLYHIVPDDPHLIRQCIDETLPLADAILISGGTGVSPRDNTVDTLGDMLDKELVGFGELFRMLSYEEIGAAAMLSRATGGVYKDKPIFAMPGSPKAVVLALKKLILPELPHLIAEVRR